jgi:hypothetical protein
MKQERTTEETLNDKLILALGTLKHRYASCDSKGHRRVNSSTDECDYCYRRLEYTAPETEAELIEREKLHELDHPADAPIMMEKREREMGSQRTFDGAQRISNLLNIIDHYNIFD